MNNKNSFFVFVFLQSSTNGKNKSAGADDGLPNIGYASYHFHEKESYISYSNAKGS